MELKLSIPVSFGGMNAHIYGGPFRNFEPGTRRLVGVKMAAEIDHPHDISVPTEDFSVPDEEDMQRGILSGLTMILRGNDLYAGCMGGIGRTGLYMGCMAKVMFDYAAQVKGSVAIPGMAKNTDPVCYVRKHFKAHAIETEEQKDFVRNFDTTTAVMLLKQHLGPVVEVKYIERHTRTYVDRIVYKSPWQWVKDKFEAVIRG